MRTPKELHPEERIIYRPELLECPQCGISLKMYNYLARDKTVQTMDKVLSIGSRPGRCSDDVCTR